MEKVDLHIKITVFDHRYLDKDDDYLLIHVFDDILGDCVTIRNLEQSRSMTKPGHVQLQYSPGPWYDKGLNGKVSAIRIEQWNPDPSEKYSRFKMS